MPMDAVMLKAWYAQRMPPGATPFEALQVLTDAVVEAGVAPHERESAMAARARFLSSTLAEMERYASGVGEVPAIVVRSGHATDSTIEAGRNLMAYFVGVAHLQGIGTVQDRSSARKWLLRAAEGGSMSAKAMLARLQAAEN
jgi:TPR repeat protein